MTHGLWIGARDISTTGTTADLAWADNTKFIKGDWVVGKVDLSSPQPRNRQEKVDIATGLNECTP